VGKGWIYTIPGVYEGYDPDLDLDSGWKHTGQVARDWSFQRWSMIIMHRILTHSLRITRKGECNNEEDVGQKKEGNNDEDSSDSEDDNAQILK